MQQRIRLGVLFGGSSCEHEVSIVSALQLMSRANPFRYEVCPVYITRQGQWYAGGALWRMETFLNFDPRKSGLVRVYPDVTADSGTLVSVSRGLPFTGEKRHVYARLDCVIPVFHGGMGENGSIQGLLELMNLPYAMTGVAGSAIGMDKVMMKAFFRGHGFPVLPDLAFARRVFEKKPEAAVAQVEKELHYPVFVKPANLGSSIGVSRADNSRQLLDALLLAFTLDRRVLVEKGLVQPVEVNCSVLGDESQALPSVVEMPVKLQTEKMLTFEGKYLSNSEQSGMAALGRQIPAPIGETLTQQVQQLSVQIFKALDCRGVVRVDYMLEPGSNKLYITEINTIPGSLSFYLWDKTGESMNYTQLIDRLVSLAFEAHAEKQRSETAYASDIIAAAVKRQGMAKGAKG